MDDRPRLRIFKRIEGSDFRQPRRGVFLLPNLVTTGALFSGFYSIVAAMHGRFSAAAIAILAATILDAIDGRIARLTKTESAFGVQYDSLSDMVSFGVAPAVVVFQWGLDSLEQFGWIVTFVYMACAALRLARFNTSGDLRSFMGLPSPSAAVIVVAAVWIWADSGQTNPGILGVVVMALLVTGIGLLMVSNFEYMSPKVFSVKDRVPFVVMVLVVCAFSVVLADPPIVIFTLFLLYALSGPVIYVWHRFRPSPEQPQ